MSAFDRGAVRLARAPKCRSVLCRIERSISVFVVILKFPMSLQLYRGRVLNGSSM